MLWTCLVRQLARRATQCEPLETGMASVGLVLSGAESQRETVVGSWRNVEVDRAFGGGAVYLEGRS